MKKLRIVFVMLILALIMSGCSNSEVSTKIESKGNTVSSENVINYETFINAMKAKGYFPEEIEPSQYDVDHSFFSVPAKNIKVNEEVISIYEFKDYDIAKSQSQLISSDGYQIGNINIEWCEKPHFYLQGKMIVGYIGTNETILKDLSEIIGETITKP